MDVRQGFFIEGNFVDRAASGCTVGLISPSTEEVTFQVPQAGEAEIDSAIAAARRAFDEGPWPRMTTKERADLITAACDALEPKIEAAAQIQADEMGAPVTLGRMTARSAIDVVRVMATEVVGYDEIDARTGQWEYEMRTSPYGVVAVISPWNGPFAATVMKSSTALLAGCTVVDKPPPEAPLSSLLFAEALSEAGLPAGAFNIVGADGRLGERLVSSRAVDMISFTGGTTVGKSIGRIAGEQLKRVVLELGGKSAAVVLPDGSLEAAVDAVASGVFFNTGQVCSSLTRLLVPERMAEEAVDRLVEFARNLRLGDPHEETAQLGPLATRRQFERVSEYVRLGTAEGARLATGGGRPAQFNQGWFFSPTVFAAVRNSMRLAQEEIFGPVASVLTYRNEDDAAVQANDSVYGLNGAVFSADEGRAIRFATRLRTGAVTINGFAQNFSAPRHHIKDSGAGVRTGREGYAAHRLQKLYNLRPAATAMQNLRVVR
jgi:acyl-CoA reductase-like NAD-dependent aldehyde dehydrogenase